MVEEFEDGEIHAHSVVCASGDDCETPVTCLVSHLGEI